MQIAKLFNCIFCLYDSSSFVWRMVRSKKEEKNPSRNKERQVRNSTRRRVLLLERAVHKRIRQRYCTTFHNYNSVNLYSTCLQLFCFFSCPNKRCCSAVLLFRGLALLFFLFSFSKDGVFQKNPKRRTALLETGVVQNKHHWKTQEEQSGSSFQSKAALTHSLEEPQEPQEPQEKNPKKQQKEKKRFLWCCSSSSWGVVTCRSGVRWRTALLLPAVLLFAASSLGVLQPCRSGVRCFFVLVFFLLIEEPQKKNRSGVRCFFFLLLKNGSSCSGFFWNKQHREWEFLVGFNEPLFCVSHNYICNL